MCSGSIHFGLCFVIRVWTISNTCFSVVYWTYVVSYLRADYLKAFVRSRLSKSACAKQMPCLPTAYPTTHTHKVKHKTLLTLCCCYTARDASCLIQMNHVTDECVVVTKAPCMSHMSITAHTPATMAWLELVGLIKYRSLLQKLVSFLGLFCKRDL